MLSECCTFCRGFQKNVSRASSLQLFPVQERETDWPLFRQQLLRLFCILHEAVRERSPSITIHRFPR